MDVRNNPSFGMSYSVFQPALDKANPRAREKFMKVVEASADKLNEITGPTTHATIIPTLYDSDGNIGLVKVASHPVKDLRKMLKHFSETIDFIVKTLFGKPTDDQTFAVIHEKFNSKSLVDIVEKSVKNTKERY